MPFSSRIRRLKDTFPVPPIPVEYRRDVAGLKVGRVNVRKYNVWRVSGWDIGFTRPSRESDQVLLLREGSQYDFAGIGTCNFLSKVVVRCVIGVVRSRNIRGV